MTPEVCREIVEERMAEWGRSAVENHSTPALMISVGHDHRSGELHLHVPEGIAQQDVVKLVAFAYRELCNPFKR